MLVHLKAVGDDDNDRHLLPNWSQAFLALTQIHNPNKKAKSSVTSMCRNYN